MAFRFLNKRVLRSAAQPQTGPTINERPKDQRLVLSSAFTKSVRTFYRYRSRHSTACLCLQRHNPWSARSQFDPFRSDIRRVLCCVVQFGLVGRLSLRSTSDLIDR